MNSVSMNEIFGENPNDKAGRMNWWCNTPVDVETTTGSIARFYIALHSGLYDMEESMKRVVVDTIDTGCK